MTSYIGARGFGSAGVFVQRLPSARRLPLDPRVGLADWGGALGWGRFNGAALQTALAILADHFGPDQERDALALHPGFAAAFLAPIAADHWSIEGDEIDEYIALLRDDPVGFV